jgi:hypothetical protein
MRFGVGFPAGQCRNRSRPATTVGSQKFAERFLLKSRRRPDSGTQGYSGSPRNDVFPAAGSSGTRPGWNASSLHRRRWPHRVRRAKPSAGPYSGRPTILPGSACQDAGASSCDTPCGDTGASSLPATGRRYSPESFHGDGRASCGGGLNLANTTYSRKMETTRFRDMRNS